MIPVRKIGIETRTVWAVACLDCLSEVRFGFVGDDEPAARFRRRRCASCAKANRLRKRREKARQRCARERELIARGKASAQREFAREERKRRARWRTVPASLRQKDSTNGA